MPTNTIPPASLALLRRGTAIPAHLLALDANRQLDERRQRALSRYHLDAGAGGLAVGVHSTQFAIRDVGLYRPVLELAMHGSAALGAAGRQAPAGHDRGAGRPDRAGVFGSRDRAAARLSRGPVEPCRAARLG